MKLFGYELGWPIVKAVGELPASVQEVRHNNADSDLESRSVQGDAMADWFLQTYSKLPPKEVENILRMALAGNLWQQANLCQRMIDSWPMLAKCQYELRSALSQTQFVVHPHAEPGEEPTESAKEKADLVRRTLEGMRPNRFEDEDGFSGMVFDLGNAVLNGYSIVELLWDEDARDDKGNKEKRVRATAFVHPRHYTFFPNGSIGIAAVETTNDMTLTFPSQIRRLPVLNNPSKFLVAKFKSKSGSALGAGWIRPLAYWWCTVVYGRDFMLNFAQKYGNPFMDIAYQSGIAETDIAKFERAAKRAANQGFMVRPDSGAVEIKPAQSMGASNPQVELAEMADRFCQLLLLGQTLTSSVSRDGGSRAQATVHADKESSRIENLQKWIAGILTEQLCESLLIENYGDSSERPRIEADATRPLDALEQAQFLAALSTCTVPLPVADTYKKLGIPAPAEGDAVLVAGKLGTLGATDTEIEANPQPPPPPSFDANGNPTPNEDGTFPLPPNQGKDKQDDFTSAKFSGTRLRSILAKLPERELAEVKTLVIAAKQAPHMNGEFTKLQSRLSELAKGTR